MLIFYCIVKCGDYLKNSIFKKGGIIGIFGEIKKVDENDINYIVVFLFFYVISSGEIVCIIIGGRFGECIWLENSLNIYDVFII